MKLRIIALSVLVSGLALFAGSLVKAKKQKPSRPSSFVLQYLNSRAQNGSTLAPYYYAVRSVSAAGEWKETRYGFDGRVSTLGATGDGVYTVAGDAKQYFANNSLEAVGIPNSEDDLRNSPQFVRVEELAGLRTFVLREDAGDFEIESSYSPKTGPTPLKRVMRTKEGTEGSFVDVKEAISVEFKDLSQGEVKLPNLPIRFDMASEKIEALRQGGQRDRAEMLEQAINRIKANTK